MRFPLFDVNYYLALSYGLLYLANVCLGSHSSLRVDNGAYKGLVIAISPDIEVNGDKDQLDLLDKLKNLVSDASKVLSETTGLYFSEVTIRVPNGWTTTPTTTVQIRDTDADVIVINRDVEQSFCMQYAGCGEPALPITVTKKTVTDGNGAKQLIHEWAHYRYGVFNEFGFKSDPIYPAYYSIAGNPNASEILVNSCADREFSYNTETGTGRKCDLSTSNTTGLPTDDHCQPILTQTNNFESSLMFAHSVESVKHFCGDTRSGGQGSHRHNSKSPNKQNVLCDGRDTWTVIKSHPDLANHHLYRQTNRITDQTNAEPTFIIAKQSDIPDNNMRTLFAIQNVKMANDPNDDRIKWVNLGLMKFEKLFANTAVSLFTFVSGADQDIKNVHPWTTGNNLRTLRRSTETTESLDFENVLAHGITLFNNRANGGIFIIVIGGPGIKTSNSVEKVDKLAVQLRDKGIKLNIIVFPFDSHENRVFASSLFQRAASVTSGRVVYVREDSSAIRTAHQFVKAFGALSDDYQIIDEKYVENSGDSIDFEINVDSTLKGKTVRVYFMRTNTFATESTLSNVKLQVPTGRTINMNFISINNYFEGCVFTTTSDDLSGKWHLTATRDVSKSESVVAVVEVVTDSVDDESITAQCWLNTQVFNPRTDTNRPVMAYVNIHKKLDELIANVSVKLSVIYDAKGSQPKVIDMYDNGSGAPDITKGDGIFSNYITDIGNQGYYTVSADISNIESTVDLTTNFGSTSLPKTSSDTACCGSRVDGKLDSITLSVTKLSRKLECGTLFVTDNHVSREYPPNPVRDLRAESVEYEKRTINLLWTAPGGDYTSGYTDKYVIKAFHQNDSHEEDEKLLQEIRTKFDDLIGADISVTIDTMADGYGKEQRCYIRFNTDTEGVYYVALRAYNTHKYPSVVSNVVLTYIKSNVIIESTTANK